MAGGLSTLTRAQWPGENTRASGPPRARETRALTEERRSMRIRPLRLIAALAALLTLAAAPIAATAQDKDTLVIALDTLGAQVMDPIADTRAPHAHYHAPVWDSLVGFDLAPG